MATKLCGLAKKPDKLFHGLLKFGGKSLAVAFGVYYPETERARVYHPFFQLVLAKNTFS